MAYVSISKEEFIDYYNKWFYSDLYKYRTHLSDESIIPKSIHHYIIPPENRDYLLFYSERNNETKTTPENACMFATAFFYTYAFI